MDTDTILTEIPGYIERLFDSYDCTQLLYHNFHHTQQVVIHSVEIADHYDLDSHSRFVLQAAAWFHDTGQLKGDMAVHEATGMQFMEDFFSGKPIDKNTILTIADCIMATKMPTSPRTFMEEILCDADTYHLGTTDFQQLDKLVWLELELRLDKPVEDQLQKSLVFLEEHRFFTSYCQERLSEGKNKNIALLKAMIGQQGK